MTHRAKKLTPPSTSYWEFTKLAFPIWVANIAVVSGGSIDTLMAGHLGANQLAGVAIGTAISVSVQVALTGVMQGLSPIVGHHYGANLHHRIGEELHQTMWICGMLSILGIGILSCTPVWMALTNSKGEVAQVATLYLLFSCVAVPAIMAARAYSSLNAAVSRPKIAMLISLLMVILRAPLNYLFIYGVGPFPELGGAGCGLSSAIDGLGALAIFWAIWRFDPFYERMRKKTFSWPKPKIILNQLKLGIPIGLSSFFEVTSFSFMTIFISRLGAVTVSGHQIVANITSIVCMLPFSFAISGMVLVSQSLGAGSAESARKATQRTLKMSLAAALLTTALVYAFRYQVVSLYTNATQVIEIAVSLLAIATLYYVSDAVNNAGSFALRGYRIALVPMALYGFLVWGCGLGIGGLLCFSSFFSQKPIGAAGYWTAVSIGLMICGLVVSGLAFYVANQVCLGKKVRIS